MRAQVALVATEDRAGVTFEDGVLGVVGPPEKRIKRMARFGWAKDLRGASHI